MTWTTEDDRAVVIAWLAAQGRWVPVAELAEFMRELGYTTRGASTDRVRLVRAGRIERRPSPAGHEYRVPELP